MNFFFILSKKKLFWWERTFYLKNQPSAYNKNKYISVSLLRKKFIIRKFENVSNNQGNGKEGTCLYVMFVVQYKKEERYLCEKFVV